MPVYSLHLSNWREISSMWEIRNSLTDFSTFLRNETVFCRIVIWLKLICECKNIGKMNVIYPFQTDFREKVWQKLSGDGFVSVHSDWQQIKWGNGWKNTVYPNQCQIICCRHISTNWRSPCGNESNVLYSHTDVTYNDASANRVAQLYRTKTKFNHNNRITYRYEVIEKWHF